MRDVCAAAKAVVRARGDTPTLKAVFARSPVPMVMVDAYRRYVDVNRAARLWFRLSLDQMRMYSIDDLASPGQGRDIEREWARLLEEKCVTGRYASVRPGRRGDIVYCALADVLPGLHVVVFAPADSPESEPGATEDDASGDRRVSLTPREIEVLALAADGLSGLELAEALVLSPSTVNTHFKNIYAKLDVRSRSAAVAKAMRLGLIV